MKKKNPTLILALIYLFVILVNYWLIFRTLFGVTNYLFEGGHSKATHDVLASLSDNLGYILFLSISSLLFISITSIVIIHKTRKKLHYANSKEKNESIL